MKVYRKKHTIIYCYCSQAVVTYMSKPLYTVTMHTSYQPLDQSTVPVLHEASHTDSPTI